MVAPSPKPAMWQLKEPSKPKCVCAHTQFITAEHMANILTHVSRARKTNRARAARGNGPLRGGCAAAAGPGAGRVGPPGGELGPGGGELAGWPRRATARAPATPRLGIKSGRGPARSPSTSPAARRAPGKQASCWRAGPAYWGMRGTRRSLRAAVEPASPLAVRRWPPLPPGIGTLSRHGPCGGLGERCLRALPSSPSCARLWVLCAPSGVPLPLAAPDSAGSPSHGVRKQQVGKCWASEVLLRLLWFWRAGAIGEGQAPPVAPADRKSFTCSRGQVLPPSRASPRGRGNGSALRGWAGAPPGGG